MDNCVTAKGRLNPIMGRRMQPICELGPETTSVQHVAHRTLHISDVQWHTAIRVLGEHVAQRLDAGGINVVDAGGVEDNSSRRSVSGRDQCRLDVGSVDERQRGVDP
jgi:hypothetical protein